MPKFKHTPGEWWASPIGEILKMPEQIKICNRVSGATLEESRANIRLIRNAPEMYDLLCDCISDYEAGISKGTIGAIKSLIYEIEGGK